MSIDGRVIRGVVCTMDSFVRSFNRLPRNIQAEAMAAIRSTLLLSLDAPPRALHLHQLTNRKVSSAVHTNSQVTPWTIHICKGDQYKASFTFEGGVAYFRLCGEHDIIDKRP